MRKIIVAMGPSIMTALIMAITMAMSTVTPRQRRMVSSRSTTIININIIGVNPQTAPSLKGAAVWVVESAVRYTVTTYRITGYSLC